MPSKAKSTNVASRNIIVTVEHRLGGMNKNAQKAKVLTIGPEFITVRYVPQGEYSGALKTITEKFSIKNQKFSNDGGWITHHTITTGFEEILKVHKELYGE